MVRLTPELIQESNQYINPVKEYELSLRGYRIPLIENLGATLDQFGCIDLSDNDIKRLADIPYLSKLTSLLLNNNRISRISSDITMNLPNLKSLILTNNNIHDFSEIDCLARFKSLWCLSLLRNPIALRKSYRSYVIHRLPQLRVLDFRRIKMKERNQAKEMFKNSAKNAGKGKPNAKKTFVPGGNLNQEVRHKISKAELESIKKAIDEAKSIQEVEHLTNILHLGLVPGKEPTASISEENAEAEATKQDSEHEEDEEMNCEETENQ